NAPPGIYTIFVDGVSGLGNDGEEPFVAVASVEDCKSADVEQFGAVHRGYTAQDLISAVKLSGQASGISNLSLSFSENSIAGAIITAKGIYNGFTWSGSAALVAQNGVLDIMPTGGTIFGMNVPAQQVVEQIAAVIGQNPSNLDPGFVVDRLFTCNSVMMGRRADPNLAAEQLPQRAPGALRHHAVGLNLAVGRRDRRLQSVEQLAGGGGTARRIAVHRQLQHRRKRRR